MDTTYRLTQKGSEVQEALNQVPVNTEGIQTLGSEKVDKVPGKQLSQEDFTSTEKSKLGALPTRQELTEEENLKADKSTTYTKTEVDTKLGQKQDTIPDLQTIREGAAAGATAYQKPQTGIPQSDMSTDVQTKLNAAGSASADIAAERLARETADLAINEALGTKLNQSQVNALITAAVANFVTGSDVSTAIATALASYSTTAEVNLAIQNAITTALASYYTSAVINQMLSEKVNKVDGKQLSTEDFTTALKNKLDALPTSAGLATQISNAISDALASYYTKAQTDSLLDQKQTAQQVADAIAAALTSYSTTSQMNTAISTALGSYYTKTEVDTKFERVQFLERGLGKYDTVRTVTLAQATAGKYVNVNGQEVSASGYGISEEVQLNAGDIMLVPSASAVPADVSLFARIVTRTYQKVINYTYTYRQDYPELPATATADYNPALIYTAQYDETGETPVLTGWLMGGQTYTTLPATREVTESYYEPLMKQAVAAMPSTGYYVYLCPTAMTIVVSGYTATVSGGVAQVVGLGIFKNIATNFIGAPGQAVLAQAIAQLVGEIEGLKAQLENLGETRAVCINSEEVPQVQNVPMIVTGSGAPSAPNVPAFVGQKYLDTTNKKEYTAFSVTNSISDWVLIN